MRYSNDLIERFKKYFKEKYNTDYSDEKAEEALDNMSGLTEVFVEIEQEEMRNKTLKNKD